MASDPFYIKQGDTREYLRRTLKNSDGTVMDLTDASVQFHMTVAGVLTIDEAAEIIAPTTSGVVEYRWQTGEGETDTVGEHAAEFEVTFADGTIVTVPNDRNIRIHVMEELG